jgi:hypothetical protein
MNEASFRRELLTILQEYADADYWGDWLHEEDNPYDFVDRIMDLCEEYYTVKRNAFSLDDLHG